MKKWRRRYQYICEKCKKVRFTLNWNRKENQMCTICQKSEVPDNQQSLFKEIDDMITDGVNKSPDLKI